MLTKDETIKTTWNLISRSLNWKSSSSIQDEGCSTQNFRRQIVSILDSREDDRYISRFPDSMKIDSIITKRKLSKHEISDKNKKKTQDFLNIPFSLTHSMYLNGKLIVSPPPFKPSFIYLWTLVTLSIFWQLNKNTDVRSFICVNRHSTGSREVYTGAQFLF